jgi:hypothetical protein
VQASTCWRTLPAHRASAPWRTSAAGPMSSTTCPSLLRASPTPRCLPGSFSPFLPLGACWKSHLLPGSFADGFDHSQSGGDPCSSALCGWNRCKCLSLCVVACPGPIPFILLRIQGNTKLKPYFTAWWKSRRGQLRMRDEMLRTSCHIKDVSGWAQITC